MKAFDQIIGNSQPIQEILAEIEKVAPTNGRVLITGESGTGKELVAYAVHNLSLRHKAAFVKVNCAAIPKDLIESELFGHERGAFTGASSQRIGKFEQADDGTIFLDEIADMSPSTQAKVLRVLEEQEFERVGGGQTVHVDVRVISATNKDLQEEIQGDNFREDLYYRLNVVPLHILPLRERVTDLPLLIDYFLSRFCRENQKPNMTVHENALAVLSGYNWPGNVRELRNMVERLVILCPRETIEADDLPNEVVNPKPSDDPSDDPSEESSTSVETPVKELFEYPVAVFCKLCSTNNNLKLNQLVEWVQNEIEAHRDLVNETETEIASWGSSREELVRKLKEVVQSASEHLSALLNAPTPTPVNITGKTLEDCQRAVCEFFKKEYNDCEAKAARALGIKTPQFQKWLENPDCTTDVEERSDLEPFPIKEVESLLDISVETFLLYPISSHTMNTLEIKEKLRTARIALSVLLAQLQDKHGTICMGGMKWVNIKKEIYRRAIYLYPTRTEAAKRVSVDLHTIPKESPSRHTLF